MPTYINEYAVTVLLLDRGGKKAMRLLFSIIEVAFCDQMQ